MHMQAITYQDFSYFGDFMFEISRWNLL